MLLTKFDYIGGHDQFGFRNKEFVVSVDMQANVCIE